MKRIFSLIIAAIMLTALFAITPSAAEVPEADIINLSFSAAGVVDINNVIEVDCYYANHQDDDRTKFADDAADYMVKTKYDIGNGDVWAYAFDKYEKGNNLVGVFTENGYETFNSTRTDDNGFSVEILMTIPDPRFGDKWYPTSPDTDADGVKGSWVFGSGTNGSGWGLLIDENCKFGIYMRCTDSKNIMKSNDSYEIGQAVDVVYTFNGDDNVSLYVNGVLQASMTLPTTGKGSSTSSKYIGITNDAFDAGLNGTYSFGESKIFAYNVYSSALTADEAKALYDYRADPANGLEPGEETTVEETTTEAATTVAAETDEDTTANSDSTEKADETTAAEDKKDDSKTDEKSGLGTGAIIGIVAAVVVVVAVVVVIIVKKRK